MVEQSNPSQSHRPPLVGLPGRERLIRRIPLAPHTGTLIPDPDRSFRQSPRPGVIDTETLIHFFPNLLRCTFGVVLYLSLPSVSHGPCRPRVTPQGSKPQVPPSPPRTGGRNVANLLRRPRLTHGTSPRSSSDPDRGPSPYRVVSTTHVISLSSWGHSFRDAPILARISHLYTCLLEVTCPPLRRLRPFLLPPSGTRTRLDDDTQSDPDPSTFLWLYPP